jgi:branched-chain amino acid transport system ATP-binding protein
LLELRNIRAGYGTGKVLENVNLVVPKGAVVALLGPNGAGKTTLLRVASGLLAPSAGQVIFDGKDMTGASAFTMAKAGLCHVPEGRGVFPTLSVADNLRLQAPASVDRQALARIAPVFPRLQQRRHQLAGTLSGGEQQMLALARAYVANASTVLLDEVSMGLAPKIVDEIFDYLRRLAGEGLSLLVVEQYVSRALELADYVYILERGRIRFAGEPNEIDDATIVESYLGALGT